MRHWTVGDPCCDAIWEAAYRRFETDDQETGKFLSRLRRAGAAAWDKSSEVVELFCGRGNGLHALHRLGFKNVEGVDLSPHLLAQYAGSAQLYVGDCRDLKFEDRSKDLVVVQGGLHHLAELPGDLERVLAEVRRVLRPEGFVLIVEPWLTPFLRVVHAACSVRLLRRLWGKLDALAVMIERERATYEQWLAQPDTVREVLLGHFEGPPPTVGWGKMTFVGRPRPRGGHPT